MKQYIDKLLNELIVFDPSQLPPQTDFLFESQQAINENNIPTSEDNRIPEGLPVEDLTQLYNDYTDA